MDDCLRLDFFLISGCHGREVAPRVPMSTFSYGAARKAALVDELAKVEARL